MGLIRPCQKLNHSSSHHVFSLKTFHMVNAKYGASGCLETFISDLLNYFNALGDQNAHMKTIEAFVALLVLKIFGVHVNKQLS